MVSIRAYVTDLLDVPEVPVVMALLSSIERIVPVISGVVGTLVYYATSETFKSCFFLIVTVNFVILMALGV